MTLETESIHLELPTGTVKTDAETRTRFGRNAYTQEVITTNTPLAVVFAKSIADVQATARYANQHHIPLTVWGAGTPIVNSSAGLTDGIVLDLSGLSHIININIPNQYAVVEAGVLNGDLDQAARKQGYFFAPDPGSKPISSIGGNIATNAGGMSSLKYGTRLSNPLSASKSF